MHEGGRLFAWDFRIIDAGSQDIDQFTARTADHDAGLHA